MVDYVKYTLSPALIAVSAYGLGLGGNFVWLGLGVLLCILFFDAFLDRIMACATSAGRGSTMRSCRYRS